MTSIEGELGDACRRAEQEAIAAIRARSAAAALAHEALSLLHVARVRKLLGATVRASGAATALPKDVEILAV